MPEDTQEKRSGAAATQADAALSDDAVRRYLERHPEFFLVHPDLLARMTPPAREFSSDGAAEIIDLQQYMLHESRAKAANLEGQLSEVVGLAREGMQGHARIQSAVLAVVGARSLDHMIDVVTTDLAVLLDLDVVVLAAEAGDVPRLTDGGVQRLPAGAIARMLGANDVVLQQNITGDRQLYGSSAGLVRSQALIRLAVDEHGPPAMLAMGVRRPREFSPSQGTDLLTFLGRVMTQCLKNRLDHGG